MNGFKVQFFSPETQMIFDHVILLSVNGLEGEIVILSHHSPYLIYLLPGLISIKTRDQKVEKVVVGNGILEVADNNCNVITNQIQVFDYMIDEESLKRKRIGVYSFFDECF